MGYIHFGDEFIQGWVQMENAGAVEGDSRGLIRVDLIFAWSEPDQRMILGTCLRHIFHFSFDTNSSLFAGLCESTGGFERLRGGTLGTEATMLQLTTRCGWRLQEKAVPIIVMASRVTLTTMEC